MRNPITKYSLIINLTLILSCGDNVYESVDKKTTEEKAVKALELGLSDKAISLLTGGLEKEPNNYTFRSLLSSAYAQKYKVDFISIAESMASKNASDNNNSSVFVGVWPYLPDATKESLAGVSTAVSLLDSIPESSRISADHFKMAILGIAYSSLSLKSFDRNGDGNLDLDELLNLDAESAEAIVASILGSTLAVSKLAETNEKTAKAAKKVQEINNTIDTSEGANAQEKLINYLTPS